MRVIGRSEPSGEFDDLTSAELARAIRLIAVRSRHQAAGLFAGNYASAFRGGGLEFEETRPYVAGDDVRSIDWVATARIGEPYVKCFREERNHTLLFALDKSASMRFGAVGRSKAAFATRAIALLAAAAARAGDRTGLVVFDEEVRTLIPAGRGRAHTWNLIRATARAAAHPSGATQIRSGLRALRRHVAHRPTIVLLSDFRQTRSAEALQFLASPHRGLLELARACDLVAVGITDPLEEELPDAGPVRLKDAEHPTSTYVLDTGSRRVRSRYARAFSEWRERTDRALRRNGAETLWLRCDRDPLFALGHFFEERAKRRQRVRV